MDAGTAIMRTRFGGYTFVNAAPPKHGRSTPSLHRPWIGRPRRSVNAKARAKAKGKSAKAPPAGPGPVNFHIKADIARARRRNQESISLDVALEAAERRAAADADEAEADAAATTTTTATTTLPAPGKSAATRGAVEAAGLKWLTKSHSTAGASGELVLWHTQSAPQRAAALERRNHAQRQLRQNKMANVVQAVETRVEVGAVRKAREAALNEAFANWGHGVAETVSADALPGNAVSGVELSRITHKLETKLAAHSDVTMRSWHAVLESYATRSRIDVSQPDTHRGGYAGTHFLTFDDFEFLVRRQLHMNERELTAADVLTVWVGACNLATLHAQQAKRGRQNGRMRIFAKPKGKEQRYCTVREMARFLHECKRRSAMSMIGAIVGRMEEGLLLMEILHDMVDVVQGGPTRREPSPAGHPYLLVIERLFLKYSEKNPRVKSLSEGEFWALCKETFNLRAGSSGLLGEEKAMLWASLDLDHSRSVSATEFAEFIGTWSTMQPYESRGGYDDRGRKLGRPEGPAAKQRPFDDGARPRRLMLDREYQSLIGCAKAGNLKAVAKVVRAATARLGRAVDVDWVHDEAVPRDSDGVALLVMPQRTLPPGRRGPAPLGNGMRAMPSTQGYNALHFAIINDRHDVVLYLIAQGADVNRATRAGDTPLHVFAASCELAYAARVCTALLEGGAALLAQNHALQTPLNVASALGKWTLSALFNEIATCRSWPRFKKKHVDVGEFIGARQLREAVRAGDMDDIERSLADMAEPGKQARAVLDGVDDRGWNVLHEAAHVGRLGILDRLLRHVSHERLLDKTTGAGLSALFLCVAAGHRECVLRLLEAGAKLRLPNQTKTAASVAAGTHRSGLAALLAEVSAERGGFKAWAAREGSSEAWACCASIAHLHVQLEADRKRKHRGGRARRPSTNKAGALKLHALSEVLGWGV